MSKGKKTAKRSRLLSEADHRRVRFLVIDEDLFRPRRGEPADIGGDGELGDRLVVLRLDETDPAAEQRLLRGQHVVQIGFGRARLLI